MGNNLKALDFEYLLIEHYKKLNISENELAVILVINHLLKQHNHIITADHLSLKMNWKAKEIDELLSCLVKKNIVDLDLNASTPRLSLVPLKTKLLNQFKIDLLNEEQAKKDELVNVIKNVYTLLESHLKRTLSPLEVSRIQEWFTMNYDEKDIVNSVKDLVATGKKVTIRAVDKKLLQKAKAEELDKEGVTTLSENWSMNLEETIKLAKTKWLEDSDD